MAIYHFTMRMVQRSKGQSAVQVAASRSGTRLYDERYGRTRRPVRKDAPCYSVILLVPRARWRERAILSNEVEARERRSDAALPREIEVALPVELPLSASIDLAAAFADAVFIRRGMVVDLNVWAQQTEHGQVLPWASLLLDHPRDRRRRFWPEGPGVE